MFWKGFPYFMLKGKQQIHHGHFIASANGVGIHGIYQILKCNGLKKCGIVHPNAI